MKNIPIVSAATAWTNDKTGEVVILYFHQVLWYGKRLQHSLLNPNQIRHYGQPLCDDILTDKSRPFGIDIDNEFIIPFTMSGTNIYFQYRVPSQWELDHCRTFAITHDSTWEPTTVNIASVTQATDNRMSIELLSMSDAYDDQTFLTRVIGAVNIHDARTRNTAYIGVRDRHSHVSVEEVARKFKCGIEAARQTLKATTQFGIRHAIHPLHRRYRVDTHNFNRRRLNDVFYTDTLFSKVKSLNGNVCAQFYTNGR
jgi:hypothetical protein